MVPQVPEFSACFDAREKWLGMQYADHLTLPPVQFSSPDVVLVEAKIRKRYTDSHKTSWSVEFELDCVALLHSAPKARLVKNIAPFEI